MRNFIKKADVILIITLFLFAISFYFIFDLAKIKGGYVEVKINGKVKNKLNINMDIEYDILSNNGELINKIKIEKGKVKMIYSTCNDEICIKQGKIEFTNETITCLPNKVTIGIGNNNNEEYDFDAIVK